MDTRLRGDDRLTDFLRDHHLFTISKFPADKVNFYSYLVSSQVEISGKTKEQPYNPLTAAQRLLVQSGYLPQNQEVIQTRQKV
jgi:hypothetical protein